MNTSTIQTLQALEATLARMSPADRRALLLPAYRTTLTSDRPFVTGHCYVMAEAGYHMTGREAKPMFVRHEGVSHWFLRFGFEVWDPTRPQFLTPVPYVEAIGKGFLTKTPSRRAQMLISATEGLL